MHQKAKVLPAPAAGVKVYCPACSGSGYWDDTPTAPEMCTTCQGVGWTWVAEPRPKSEKARRPLLVKS